MDAKTQEIVDKFNGVALNFVVVLKEVTNVNETETGLNIGSEVDKNEKYRKGIVVAVGNLCPKNSDGTATIEVGNEILYDKYKMSEVTIDGISYEIISYADLVMIM